MATQDIDMRIHNLVPLKICKMNMRGHSSAVGNLD